MRLMRISITMVLWLTIFSAPLFSQQTKDLNPPTNLTYEVIDEHDVQLIWNQPSSGDGDWIHWDSGENADAFGFMMGAEHFAVASKWNPEHLEAYDSWTITKMRFFLTSDQPTVTLKFWTGENATEIYSQVITDFNTNDWTEITLDTPITIDASTQLWAGLDIDMPVGAGVMGMDAGPGLNGYGDMLRYQGDWYTGADLGIDNNWNIQIEIENASKSTTDLLGYNLYKNDVVLNSNPITSTSYLDQDLINGTYNYYVTAVYDEGESTASNTVEVNVNQDVINVADSLALVELYQTCNGENWTHNDNWLTGPLSSWDGVTTNNNRVEELFLSSNNVSGDIPESFGDLTGLVDFLATTNEITSIPSTFGNLESLEVCWIGWNPISSLPDNFGNLNNLVELHIGYTELQTLPSSFGNLTNLKWLAIRDSQLSGLPDNFGNLSSLRTCFAAVNQIEELPASFHLLSNLKTFMIEDNAISELPDDFGDLDNLSLLNLSSNPIEQLPESFGDLSSLDSLYMIECHLTHLPESFGDLSDLNYAQFSANNIVELPASFTNLSTIEVLRLDNNKFTALPENIGDLGNTLQLLGLANNEIVALPSSIGNLTNLWQLFLNNNELTDLPDEFIQQTSLHVLALDGNMLTKLPEQIGNLQALGYLGVIDNMLESLPESIGDLNADTLLLSGNQLYEIPESLFEKTFNFLWLDDNNLQFGSLEPFVNQVSNEFLYVPQGMFTDDEMVDVQQNSNLSHTLEISGDNNVYQWYKDNIQIDGQTTNTLYIDNVSSADLGIYILKVTNTSLPGLEIVSGNVELNILTGLGDIINTEFSISPNPVTNSTVEITLNTHVSSAQLEIYNMAGQLMMTKQVQTKTSINVSGFNSGLYMVNVVYDNGEHQIEKMIIQ